MAQPGLVACLVALLAVTSSAKDQSRWSRQISSYTSDLSDWVPLPRPVERDQPSTPMKRQAVAEPRILAEPVYQGFTRPAGFSQESFPPRNFFNQQQNRQLYLQSVPAVPSAPQNFLSEQGFGQNIRFGLSQPNFPLNQGFASPQFPFDNALKQRPAPANPIKFESFPKTSPPLVPHASQFNQLPKKIEPQRYIDGYRVENLTDFNNNKKKPQSLQKIKFENVPKTEMLPPRAKSEREEVQLLYVPLESLNRGQFNFRGQVPAGQYLNSEGFSQGLPRPNPLKQAFAPEFQRPLIKPLDTLSAEQEYFSNFNAQLQGFDQGPKFSTLSSPFPTSAPITPKPKKLKPHQPPLAIFLTQEAKKGNQIKVGDVLSSLKNADTIAVLDTVNPLNAPKVFIGPSTLNPPENFVKFELPYLSNLEHTDKKLRQLPFFVAPLSYNTPNGFAKIPFPSPHVGSVVINSQIRDSASTQSTPVADVIPNSYSTSPQTYKEPPKPVTTRPTISYYSTVPPKTNPPFIPQSNYYSFEPQTVSTIKPPQQSHVKPSKTGSYFLSNVNEQYDPAPVRYDDNFKTPEPVRAFNFKPKEMPSTPRPISTTTKPSTYPNQLLETHNPFSINSAFQFSTPLDYHNLFDENYATAPPSPASTTQSAPKSEKISDTQKYQQASYAQNYSPEIQHQTEVQNTRYSSLNNNEYTTKTAEQNPQGPSQTSSVITEYNGSVETQAPVVNDNIESVNKQQASYETETKTNSPYAYNQYDTYEEKKTTTSTSTTSTRRTPPLRTRGRPRYTTPKTDSSESTTRTVVTRRPLRERKPLPTRSRYEPNKITTERATRKPVDSSESTTKYPRSRTRGRVQFKPTESDEYYKPNKGGKSDEDLAYQRDVLHQNYPVTLMERTSPIDIEAMTEPTPRISSTKTLDDTENAYSYDRAVSQQIPDTTESKEDVQTYTSRAETQTETYIPKYSSTRGDDSPYQSRSSSAPVEAISSYSETSPDEESIYRLTTPSQRYESAEVTSYATEPSVANTEAPFYSNDFSKTVETTTIAHVETPKASQEVSQSSEREDNIVQTTPSYNRVRVRPGVVRQYHQASSTESSRTKIDRKRPIQAVTYRPAFNGRRTTMRIEEIEADLKTKQVHSRTEDHRHPVYRPDPTTEPSVTSPSHETTTKRGVYRRRRPSYSTSSTESSNSSTKKATYEVKNRFRGRRPTTEKSVEKSEVQTDSPTTTKTLYNRYNTPKLSARFNKRPTPQETEDSEDQDSNYSINIPKYIEPETEQWSPKISTDSFKPYNPNDIIDEEKPITEHRSDIDNGELDIITARNEYDDILLTVTPASNRLNKKIPDIPPTLEALVEQSKVVKNDSDSMSTFESMLEEVMKSLEEQDENEYNSNVMKHKGGEIGEIPPESVITEENKTTTTEARETTATLHEEQHAFKDAPEQKGRRRGFWKKVKVRPVTETIEAAESQYYQNSVNRLGNTITLTKTVYDKNGRYDKPKSTVTTYKPDTAFEVKQNEEVVPITEVLKANEGIKLEESNEAVTQAVETVTEVNPGNMDLGTGSPETTVSDTSYYTSSTDQTVTEGEPEPTMLDRVDGFSFMDYLFGVTPDDETSSKPESVSEVVSEQKLKAATTETTFVPEEITEPTEDVFTEFEIQKPNGTGTIKTAVDKTEKPVETETSSVSSFMDPSNVISTSMSTEISHETEICFRGKCIKTSKGLL